MVFFVNRIVLFLLFGLSVHLVELTGDECQNQDEEELIAGEEPPNLYDKNRMRIRRRAERYRNNRLHRYYDPRENCYPPQCEIIEKSEKESVSEE